MYKNKTQNSEDGSRKPRNCNQVTQKLKRAITRDYGSWMDGDGENYAGKSPMYRDALARKYNVSKSAVNYVLREAKKEEAHKMADLYAEGKNIGEIAAKFGKSRKSVKTAIAKYNGTPSKSEDNANKLEEEKKSWFKRATEHVKSHVVAYATAASLLMGAGAIYGCIRKSADSANKPAESKTLEEKTNYHAEDLTSDDLVKRMNAINKYNPNEVHDRLIREQEEAAKLAQANAAKGMPEQKPAILAKSEVKPEPLPEIKPVEPQPVPMPEPQIAEKPAEKPEVKPEPIPEPKPVEPQPIPEPQPEFEPEQMPELEPEPQPIPEPQPAEKPDKVRTFYELAEKIDDRAGSVEKNVYSKMIASAKSDAQRDGWAEAGIISLTRTLEERLSHDKLNAEETQ